MPKIMIVAVMVFDRAGYIHGAGFHHDDHFPDLCAHQKMLGFTLFGLAS
jgi:hypothetical protein